MAMAKVVSQTTQCRFAGVWRWNCSFLTSVQTQVLEQHSASAVKLQEDQCENKAIRSGLSGMAKLVSRMFLHGIFTSQARSYGVMAHAQIDDGNKAVIENPAGIRKPQIGENVSRKDKIKFLVSTLLDLKDSKEAVYGALDAWVAWEQNFPIGAIKNVLLALEKEQQWHRYIQVIKWMLSKGQGNTMGTYGQLIHALDMDHRAEEAHEIWAKKIGNDLHSVSWQLCRTMISVYYRNNMLEELVKLFKGLEAFDREPPEKSIVRKVADAYEMLGLVEEKDRILEKYNSLFSETKSPKKSKGAKKKKK
ncbi:hypothetical protein NMG60_11036514 [Bertholletia excelsa]